MTIVATKLRQIADFGPKTFVIRVVKPPAAALDAACWVRSFWSIGEHIKAWFSDEKYFSGFAETQRKPSQTQASRQSLKPHLAAPNPDSFSWAPRADTPSRTWVFTALLGNIAHLIPNYVHRGQERIGAAKQKNLQKFLGQKPPLTLLADFPTLLKVAGHAVLLPRRPRPRTFYGLSGWGMFCRTFRHKFLEKTLTIGAFNGTNHRLGLGLFTDEDLGFLASKNLRENSRQNHVCLPYAFISYAKGVKGIIFLRTKPSRGKASVCFSYKWPFFSYGTVPLG